MLQNPKVHFGLFFRRFRIQFCPTIKTWPSFSSVLSFNPNLFFFKSEKFFSSTWSIYLWRLFSSSCFAESIISNKQKRIKVLKSYAKAWITANFGIFKLESFEDLAYVSKWLLNCAKICLSSCRLGTVLIGD